MPAEFSASRDKVRGRGVADVDGEEAREELRILAEDTKSTIPQGSVAAKLEHELAHPDGTAGELAMEALVVAKIAGAHGGGESESLTESQAETFAGDGVDAAGRVAGERDIAASDAVEGMHGGDGAAFAAAEWRAGETITEFWHGRKRMVEGSVFRVLGHDDDADLLGRDGSDVGLGAMAPIDFHVRGPWLNAVVAASGAALMPLARDIES